MPVFSKGDKAVLFVHVPKAGGSALENLFTANGWEMTFRDGKTGKHSQNWLRYCSPQHLHAEPLRATFRLERFDAIFMTVREPLARFRSEYAMRSGRLGLEPDAASVDAWADRALRKYAADHYVLDNHLRPQSEFLLPGSHVYRLEDGLDAVPRNLNALHDLGLPEEVPRVRESGGRGLSTREVQLSEELTARLRALYAQDASAFGYAGPEG
ncbi:sulfotransferase family 2 domain-containing protein [Georgenia alba]|uniref:Sulfotransferase family 2 domain-containing protein n=1 Tax=Georgenia alba TaxID=2233858 RepID=A0ABW2Q6D8_9MICO